MAGADLSSGQLGVAALIDDRSWNRSQKLLLALVSMAILLDGFDNQALGFALPSLMKDWQLPKAALGGALAAAQFGMLIGAVTGGMLGDRLGRKRALVGSVLLFGVGTLLIGFVGAPLQLTALRFLSGLGLGAAFPNVAALAAEFTPMRHRSFAVVLSIVCVPLGGVVGGLVASAVLPLLGWQALFVLAGGCTLLLALVLVVALPESVTFLLSRGAPEKSIGRSLRRMGIDPVQALRTLGQGGLQQAGARHLPKVPTSLVLAPAWRGDTLLLWTAFFFSLVSVYAAFNWLPTLLTENGLSVAGASQGLAAFNLGGVITALWGGAVMGRYGSRQVMLAMSAGAVVVAIVLASLARVDLPKSLLFALIGLEGGCINGVQTSLYALASGIYPAEMRARGVGLATGIGRLGAIASALFGAMVVGSLGLMGFHWSIAVVMTVVLAALWRIQRHVAPR